MTVRVATAFSDPTVETVVVRELQTKLGSAAVERRCRDIVELTAVSLAGLVDAVVVDPWMRGLDRDTVAQLTQRGVLSVGFLPLDSRAPSDDLGLRHVVRGDPEGVVKAIERKDLQAHPHSEQHPANTALLSSGLVTAVWGPPGAPGRTTVAIELAAALAARGHDTLLVDLDTVAPSVGQQLGLVDDTSGLAAAARAAAQGSLTPHLLQSVAVRVPSGMRVLVGLPSGDRWSELRAASVENVIGRVRDTFDHIVIDVGFGIEGDEISWAESGSPERYGAARTALRSADALACVGQLDPISLVRFIRSAPAAFALASTAAPVVVANRYQAVRHREAVSILADSLALPVTTQVPDDIKAFTRALRHGTSVREQSRGRSAVNASFDGLAQTVEDFVPSYDVPDASVSRSHRRLLRGAHRRHRHRDAGMV